MTAPMAAGAAMLVVAAVFSRAWQLTPVVVDGVGKRLSYVDLVNSER